MANEHILIVDDEEDIVELIRYNLTKEGYVVTAVDSGEKALKPAREEQPDLIILDLMLPGMSGLDVCRALRTDSITENIPIIMLSARGEEADIVIGLELGADDYITKPFSPRILLARIRSILRSGKRDRSYKKNKTVVIEGISINPGKHEVILQEMPVDLTATEFNILYFLALNRGWVYTRHQIVQAVHGDDYPVTDRSIDVQITGLRRKLGEFDHYIETVRGVGYRFKE